ncbi:MAG: hypothetical protein A2Y62_15270 [Candidatus Fischerbacteria bacterium RBG_13_37_8]|uniref:Uncharacterized protein n=1 Tax=Candidatus Fischerbacteria bacterium RBG_13_37_8 TaxID=1817863 RepID=A0A1F5VKP0_9BACT|nr:MAG: hypothetical protein A2Y62_15270 [Candidatus Fischerbacteria bacterium RBG_13_37_8]
MSKKKTSKDDHEKKQIRLPKDKLPYISPAQKIVDMEKDSNDIILPPDIDTGPQKDTLRRKISRHINKFKHKLMKKLNMPEIYADIIFFIIDLLIAIGIIYFIMLLLIFTKKHF